MATSLYSLSSPDTQGADGVAGESWNYLIQTYKRGMPYYCIIGIDGTTIYANRYDGTQISSGTAGTDDKTVIDAAAADASGKGIIFMKIGHYQPSAVLDFSDLDVWIIGERNPITASGAHGVYISHTGAVMQITNTGYPLQQFQNIFFDGVDDSAIAVDIYNCRERELFHNVTIKNGSTGLRMRKCWYVNNYDLKVSLCGAKALELQSPTSAEAINTVNFYGGYITASPINVTLDKTNQVNFYGTIIEGASTNAVKTLNSANGNKFLGCSFESNASNGVSAGWTVINESSGVCNSYISCRFDSDVNYNVCDIASGSRAISFIDNMIQANTNSMTATYVLEAGSSLTTLIGNREQDLSTITQSVSDSSNSYTAIANTNIADRVASGLAFGQHGIKITDAASNELDLLDSSGTLSTINFRHYASALAEIRTTGATSCAFTNSGGYIEMNCKSATGDPTTSDIRSGCYAMFKNTTSGAVKLWYNDSGTLKSVTLS